MKALGASLLAMAFLVGATGARAQEPRDEGGAAPQILTADLAFRQKVETDRLRVTFVIVDTDKVTEVRINGTPQQFAPADTVQITAELQFKQGLNTVTVEAVDEQGNKRVRKFLVGLGDVDVSAPKPITWSVAVDARYERDTNPTNNLSLPTALQSQLPEEAKSVFREKPKADYRTTLGGTLSVTRGGVSAFAGARNSSYADKKNEALETQIGFVGLSLTAGMTDSSDFKLGYTFMDVNIGGGDYAVNHLLSPAFVFNAKDDKGTYTKTLGLDAAAKDFADKKQKDTTDLTLKWSAFAIDPEGQDSYRFLLLVGSTGEGQLNKQGDVTDESLLGKDGSLYRFAGMDFDWKNRWDAGLLFDIGFGYQYRSYPYAESLALDVKGLPVRRVDNVFRFSSALGWAFGTAVSVRLNYEGLFDVSSKRPYIRDIYGLVVNGAF